MENKPAFRNASPVRTDELLAAWRGAPIVDLAALRRDSDEVLDPLFLVDVPAQDA